MGRGAGGGAVKHRGGANTQTRDGGDQETIPVISAEIWAYRSFCKALIQDPPIPTQGTEAGTKIL